MPHIWESRRGQLHQGRIVLAPRRFPALCEEVELILVFQEVRSHIGLLITVLLPSPSMTLNVCVAMASCDYESSSSSSSNDERL